MCPHIFLRVRTGHTRISTACFANFPLRRRSKRCVRNPSFLVFHSRNTRKLFARCSDACNEMICFIAVCTRIRPIRFSLVSRRFLSSIKQYVAYCCERSMSYDTSARYLLSARNDKNREKKRDDSNAIPSRRDVGHDDCPLIPDVSKRDIAIFSKYRIFKRTKKPPRKQAEVVWSDWLRSR